jgi:adenylate kinase
MASADDDDFELIAYCKMRLSIAGRKHAVKHWTKMRKRVEVALAVREA